MTKHESILMPMKLQYFADPSGDGEPTPPTDTDKGGDDHSGDNSGDGTDDKGDDKSTEIITKLQSRIGAEQSKKNELAEQLKNAQTELEKLRNGGKEDKPKEKTPEQVEIEKLKAQLDRKDVVEQTMDVFRESGSQVPKDIVSLLISDDRDQTIDNAGKLLDFITSVKSNTEKAIRKEYQAGRIPGATKHSTDTAAEFGKKVSQINQSRSSLDTFK